MKIIFIAAVCVITQIMCVVSNHIKKGQMIFREDFTRKDISHPERMHTIVIALKQNNLDKLNDMLLERSTPGNDKYMEWLTFDEIGNEILNIEAYTVVKDWLQSNSEVVISKESLRKEYIHATAPVKVWNDLFRTKFYNWEDKTQTRILDSTKLYTLAEHYSIPFELDLHIIAIFNTIQVPPIFHKKYYVESNSNSFKTNLRWNNEPVSSDGGLSVQSNSVTPDFLETFYNIPPQFIASINQSQAVFETSTQSFSPSDLSTFQSLFNRKQQTASDIGGFISQACTISTCGEGNLDIQYISGIAQDIQSIYWYVGGSNPFLTWINDVSNSTNPPKVNSISYSTAEYAVDEATLTSFNTEAMKLGLLGITILVSSGDQGVSDVTPTTNKCNYNSGSSTLSHTTNNIWTGNGYFPYFPATSPYVTSVGATMGPNNNQPESVSQSNYGAVITSGGGFSTFYSQPKWQLNATNNYFNNLQTQPSNGYNRLGRGYPDISMIGVSYAVIIGGSVNYLYGTSASTPVFAGMISLLNAQLAAVNRSSVGFLNPTLYVAGSQTNMNSIFNDININSLSGTAGSNYCCANSNYPKTSSVCCAAGFTASEGWDPTTGMQFIE